MENVISVVKGVRSWRTLAKKLVHAYDRNDGHYAFAIGSINLDNLQHQHHSDEECLKAIVEEFLEGGWPQSWRSVIWSLYLSDEIHLADQIQSYAEPLEGVCV